MSRPKREPTAAEVDVIVRMRGGPYGYPLKDVQAALAEEVGDPPSIGLLHRWVSELQQEISTAAARRAMP